MKVLINAYACSPNMGSEPGMAWNWCVNLARHCELYIITEGEFQERIEATLPNLSQGANMHFYWNPIGGDDEIQCDKIRRMCWNQGDWRFYKYYKDWQKRTAEIAKEICREEKIDVLHQLNMIGFREPGYLWKVSKETGIPFVWGPVDAKERFPMEYTTDAPSMTRLKLRLKNAITWWQLKHDRRVHEAVNQASCVISASGNSVTSFKKYFSIESPLLNETGCHVVNEEGIEVDATNKSTFDIIWVGKMDFRKQLGLALRSVAMAYHPYIRLHIVGSGNIKSYLYEAEKLGIADNCVIHGSVSHEEVQAIMQKSDVFLFTSVAEGTPHVVLEAIANRLPIVCFDTCGQGDCVNDEVGIKIPLSTPNQSVKDFAEKIEYLYVHREVLAQMSENCKQRAEELSWERKAEQMVELYKEVIEIRC